MHNRSSRPHRCPHALSTERQRMIIERRKSRQPYHQI
ncbi:MAG: hypothetical protein CVU19_09750 [Betaproteobacteria bacterium HGW-Betaproteobacteria-13]|nr:MAG: hypothetical protein CVU19_09750 [Betaproteobacteria bacterium HGW-Betaproteobacteria-13]